MLLVLDNFEHLLEAGPFVADLLTGCVALRVLVTSRTALRLRSEQRHEVPPLPTSNDPIASPAVRLFVDRAQAVSSQFVLDPTNAQTINAICRRVDGIPLAIELAAARINILTPQQLLDRLDRRLPGARWWRGGSPRPSAHLAQHARMERRTPERSRTPAVASVGGVRQ